MKDKIADYYKRKQEDRREKERIKNSPEYQPEAKGYQSERRYQNEKGN